MGPLEARLREEVTEDDLAMTVEEVQQFLRDQDPQQASMQSELVRLQQAVAVRILPLAWPLRCAFCLMPGRCGRHSASSHHQNCVMDGFEWRGKTRASKTILKEGQKKINKIWWFFGAAWK